MNRELKSAVVAHARETFPAECCGLIVLDGDAPTYRPCRNISGNPDAFAVHPEDYAAAEDIGEIIGVVHSHPNASSRPSEADKVACEASGLPWHIVGLIDGEEPEWSHIVPCGYEAPLIGRTFSHGVLDCYTLIRDWYSRERGITLPDFTREYEWWYKGGNLYVDNFQRAGFVRATGEPMPGDVLLMQIMANVPNHGAIYIGDGIILHHLFNRLSCREVFGGYYKKHCTHVLRYDPNSQGNSVG